MFYINTSFFYKRQIYSKKSHQNKQIMKETCCFNLKEHNVKTAQIKIHTKQGLRIFLF